MIGTIKRKLGIFIFTLFIIGTIVFLNNMFYKYTEQPATDKKAEKETLEYSIYFGFAAFVNYDNNKMDDVVTKYLEEKFKIKVKEVSQSVDQIQPKERLNMFIAANDIPDVVVCPQSTADYAVSTGYFADLTDYIPKMKNLNKYFPQEMWYQYMNDGRKYQIPQVKITPTDSKFKDDPLMLPYMHALWVREDILKMLGYQFTPLNDISKKYMDAGNKAPLSAYNIQPAIDTPDKFLDFLRKIKKLNLKVGGQDVIPFSSSQWSTFHLGSMYDYGHWRIDTEGNVSGYLGTPEAKEWMKMLNTMYNEGLIDKDYVLQGDAQLQKKIASGQVACGIYIPDIRSAVMSLDKMDPGNSIRFMEWPKKNKDLGFYDVVQPGFYRWLIRKDFKDIDRLIQYFDWFYSDEGMDIITWGPESAGLWKMSNGKKVFKNQEIADSLINGTKEGYRGPEYYGLWAPSANSSELTFFTAKAALCAPVMADFNPFDSRKSYPLKLDKYMANRQVAISGYDTKGKAAYSDGGINASHTSNYFWGQFQSNGIAKILSAGNSEEFESAWKQQYDLFVTKGKYSEAKADMEKWFNTYGKTKQ